MKGSTREDGANTSRRVVEVWEMCCRLHMVHGCRMVYDRHWCTEFARAASACSPKVGARVIVLGLGTGVPALAAARRGSEVIWYIRVARFAEVARRLVAMNGVSAAVRIVHCKTWEMAPRLLPPRPDGALAREGSVVITEEVGDDPLSEGVLMLARLSRASLLRPGGRFLPGVLRVYAMLCSVRTLSAAGFDLRAFNAFRSADGTGGRDLEDAALTETAGATLALSEPTLLLELDLNGAVTQLGTAAAVARRLVASREGVMNAVCWWGALELDNSTTIDLGPKLHAPVSSDSRARRQRLAYCSYERALRVGERVEVLASVRGDGRGVNVQAPADAEAERAARLVRWPPAFGVMSYHFAMVADEGRNNAFDRALISAVRSFKARHGAARPCRVLDVGSGSGLLAMMAARAGADVVHSLEMVPALAAAAEHIVNSNGYADRVTIHTAKSTETELVALGGAAFDILVAEIVDDMLLGEGILTTVADARRRLLAPDAAIIPMGGALWALAVELRPPQHEGLRLDALQVFHCDLAMTPEPLASVKLQHLVEGRDYRCLAAPIKIFTFGSWADAPIDTLCEARTSPPLPLRVTADGVMSALLIYFTLDLDGDPANAYGSGPQTKRSHWEQNARWLPHELRVQKGERLSLHASHDDHHVSVLRLTGVQGDMLEPTSVAAPIGHAQLVGLPQAQDAAVALDW